MSAWTAFTALLAFLHEFLAALLFAAMEHRDSLTVNFREFNKDCSFGDRDQFRRFVSCRHSAIVALGQSIISCRWSKGMAAFAPLKYLSLGIRVC